MTSFGFGKAASFPAEIQLGSARPKIRRITSDAGSMENAESCREFFLTDFLQTADFADDTDKNSCGENPLFATKSMEDPPSQ